MTVSHRSALLFSILAFSTFISAASLSGENRSSEDVLAIVDGEAITRSDFESRLIRHFGEVAREKFIIYEKYVEQEMTDRGLLIPEQDIDERIEQISKISVEEEGKTIDQQLDERLADRALFRHLIRLERALIKMVRQDRKIEEGKPVRNKDVVDWFRRIRLRRKSVQERRQYLPEGVIVRVGEEMVPDSHAIDLLYLVFTRDELGRFLKDMTESLLAKQMAAAAGIEIRNRDLKERMEPVHKVDDPIVDKISFEKILNAAGESVEAAEDQALFELQKEGLVRLTIPESALKEEFDKHRDWYLGKTVRLSQIFIGHSDPNSGRPRSKKERDQASITLVRIKKEVEDGADFDRMAYAYSEDSSSDRGGDIGVFPRLGAIGELLNNPALSLKQGELSDPIESGEGYHLIKAVKVKSRSGRKFKDVTDRVAEDLVRVKIASWWDEQLKKADIRVFNEKL